MKNEPFNSDQYKIDLTPIDIQDELLEMYGKNISAREKECLSFLLKGKTIKETAKLLKLSPRTIEEYLNRLKQKAGCKYKRELLALFQSKSIF